jgi:hypothetical protein
MFVPVTSSRRAKVKAQFHVFKKAMQLWAGDTGLMADFDYMAAYRRYINNLQDFSFLDSYVEVAEFHDKVDKEAA